MAPGPVIGIAAASYAVPRPFGDLPVHGISRWYAAHVLAAGGRPLLIPPGAGVDLLDVLDGLVLAGGVDLDPTLYGAPPGTAEVDRARDEAELALARTARDVGVPTLGVCRGAQLFAALDGGALDTEVEHVLPTTGHAISTVPGSACASLLGPRAQVSSLHHQAVASLGPGWQVTATADDGVVEAVEWTGAWPALGVQWHPELDATGPVVFGWLVEQADRRDLRPALAANGTRAAPVATAGTSGPERTAR